MGTGQATYGGYGIIMGT